jgi:hypothetical protein
MSTPLTKAQIITKAELYLDDMSELSTAEFGDLFNKMYNKINVSRPWEGTKREHSTTTDGNDYIILPSDFLHLTENHNHTGSSYAAEFPVVFLDTTYTPIKVVSWSDRRQYRNSGSHAYIDIVNSRLYFTKTPDSGKAVEFDYFAQMPTLELAEYPWFPAEFHDAIYHYMVSDDFMIQQSDKAKSYANENRAAADKIMEQMVMWNSRLVQI